MNLKIQKSEGTSIEEFLSKSQEMFSNEGASFNNDAFERQIDGDFPQIGDTFKVLGGIRAEVHTYKGNARGVYSTKCLHNGVEEWIDISWFLTPRVLNGYTFDGELSYTEKPITGKSVSKVWHAVARKVDHFVSAERSKQALVQALLEGTASITDKTFEFNGVAGVVRTCNSKVDGRFKAGHQFVAKAFIMRLM